MNQNIFKLTKKHESVKLCCIKIASMHVLLKPMYTLIHVSYLCTDSCIIQLSLEFIFCNLVLSKSLFNLLSLFIYYVCHKGAHPKQTYIWLLMSPAMSICKLYVLIYQCALINL